MIVDDMIFSLIAEIAPEGAAHFPAFVVANDDPLAAIASAADCLLRLVASTVSERPRAVFCAVVGTRSL